MKKLAIGIAALALSAFAMPNMALARDGHHRHHSGHHGGHHRGHMNFSRHRGGHRHFGRHHGRAHFARHWNGRHHWRHHHHHHWRNWWWPFALYGGWNDGCWQYRWTWDGYRYVNVCRWNYYYW
jgi:hypothetical protein